MPEDKKNIVKMAHMYSQEGRWDKAIAEYQKLIALEPEDFNAHSMLGDVYFKKGDTQSAFDSFLLCHEAYVRLGQSEKAALAQNKMLKLDPSSLGDEARRKLTVFRRNQEANAFLEAGDKAKAAETYAAVLALDPDQFDLYQKLGDLLLEMGDKRGASARYREIGSLYVKNRLVKKALPLFQKVLELCPDDFDAHAALADLHVKAGNESEAKKEMLYVTEVLFQRGDLDQALQYAQKAEQLRAIESYNYLGQIELKRGKRDQARAWFDKLLKFKPNHGGALWGTAMVHAAENRVEDARQLLAKVPKNDRYYGEALASLADLDAKDRPEEALKGYLEAAAALLAKAAKAQAREAGDKAKALGATPEQLKPFEGLDAGPEAAPAQGAEAAAKSPGPAAAKPAASSPKAPADAPAGAKPAAAAGAAAKPNPAPSAPAKPEPKLVGALPEKLVIIKSGEQSPPESGFKVVRGASQFMDEEGAPPEPSAGTKPKAAAAAPAPDGAKAEPSSAMLEQVKAFDAVLPASVFEPEATRAQAKAKAAEDSAKPHPEPATEPEKAPAPSTAPAAVAPALPPLAPLAAPALPELKPLEPLPAAPAPAAESAEEEIGTLLNLAEGFESDASWDEALNLYQRVLALDKNHSGAKEGVSRVYRQLAGSAARPQAPAPAAAPAPSIPAPAAVPAPVPAPSATRQVPPLPPLAPAKPSAVPVPEALDAVAPVSIPVPAPAPLAAAAPAAPAPPAPRPAGPVPGALDAAALAKAKADAEAHHRREREEAEVREREKLKALEREHEEKAAKMKAEIEALKAAEAEARERGRKAAEESAALKAGMESEIRSRLEAELRQQAQAKAKADEDARRVAEVQARLKADEDAKRLGAVQPQARHKAEDDAKRQAEVLARVQAQQRERLEPLRRSIEEVRHRVGGAEPAAAAHAAEPEHAEDGLGGLDGFMTAAVADIYVKQGLTQEARKIYEHILEREPGNAEVRAKLERMGGAPAASPPSVPLPPRPAAAPTVPPAPPAQQAQQAQPQAPPAAPAAEPQKQAPADPSAGAAKKSKVSYL